MGMAAILIMWPGPFEQTFIPYPMKTPYEIWLQSVQWFLRRRCLKSVNDKQMMDGQWTTEAYLSYKQWAFGPGDLKMVQPKLLFQMHLLIVNL